MYNSELLLNASSEEVTKQYTFSLRQPSEMDDQVLYAEPSLQGNAVIAKRQEGDNETTINLELLLQRLDEIGQSLKDSKEALALLALGSCGTERERLVSISFRTCPP